MDTQKVNETIKLFSEYTSEKDAKLIEKSINEFSIDYDYVKIIQIHN